MIFFIAIVSVLEFYRKGTGYSLNFENYNSKHKNTTVPKYLVAVSNVVHIFIQDFQYKPFFQVGK